MVSTTLVAALEPSEGQTQGDGPPGIFLEHLRAVLLWCPVAIYHRRNQPGQGAPCMLASITF
jgi:hypothetical protein